MMKASTQLAGVALAAGVVGAMLTLPATQAVAEEQSPWQIRGRVIAVVPDEDSSTNPSVGTVDAGKAVVPEVDITYFFTPNIAAELIAATSPHNMEVDLTGGGTLDLGKVWVLPPTLTLQYHFTPEAKYSPYLGAGVNYTHLWNASDTAGTSVDYDGGFGYALQAGMDIHFGNGWMWNIDVKRIFVNVDATVNGAVTADVDLDPWVIGTGLGYRF